MKMAFFAYTYNGMVAGFCQARLGSDDEYSRGGFYLDEDVHVIDIVECRTFNDAKRHQNILAGRDPEEGIDDWGEEVLR